MPVYCFKCQTCNRVEEEVREMRNARKRGPLCPDCEVTMLRDLVSEHGGFKNTPDIYPMYSEAMGVIHPHEVKLVQQKLAARGVKANFNSDLCIELRSKGHRKQVAEALGYFDRNGGYSDPSPR